MVISHKIDEKKMGNRGSKSGYLKTPVKEQRVDGSYFGLIIPKLRYTLMGFERNYQVKILSKQLNIKNFSTLTPSPCPQPGAVITGKGYPINPWFWTGLIDAEGSFSIIIDRNKNRKLGWRVQSKFKIGLHKRDYNLLILLQPRTREKELLML